MVQRVLRTTPECVVPGSSCERLFKQWAHLTYRNLSTRTFFLHPWSAGLLSVVGPSVPSLKVAGRVGRYWDQVEGCMSQWNRDSTGALGSEQNLVPRQNLVPKQAAVAVEGPGVTLPGVDWMCRGGLHRGFLGMSCSAPLKEDRCCKARDRDREVYQPCV